MKNRAGFTLLELLVVIGIVAILAAFVIPAIIAARCHARSEASQGMLDDYCVALKAYQTDFGRPAVEEPGYGVTNAKLIPLLMGQGPGGRPYYFFKSEHVQAGEWRNELHFPYRYRSAGVLWNKGGFDAWAKGCSDSAGADSMPPDACSIHNH